MRNFLLNRFAILPPYIYPAKSFQEEFTGQVLELLEKVTDSSLSLTFVCLGDVKLARYLDHRSWSTNLDSDMKKWWDEGLGRIRQTDVERDDVKISGLGPPILNPWRMG